MPNSEILAPKKKKILYSHGTNPHLLAICLAPKSARKFSLQFKAKSRNSYSLHPIPLFSIVTETKSTVKVIFKKSLEGKDKEGK